MIGEPTEYKFNAFRLKSVPLLQREDGASDLWLWFAATHIEDMWLIIRSTTEESLQVAESINAADLPVNRMVRLIPYIGSTWKDIITLPVLLAETQSQFMHNMNHDHYESLMNMTPDEIIWQRAEEEMHERIVGPSEGIGRN